MAFVPTKIPYSQTGFFSKTVIDYLGGNPALQPFFSHPVSNEGLKAAMEARKAFDTPRAGLADALTEQYANLSPSGRTKQNIELLRKATTFTITTAHQPNIFTGPLYFLYKILHAVKLADHCKKQFPDYDFVPVYYMGSEDADLDELGHIYINSRKFAWQTNQTGAVGRMIVDKNLLTLLNEVSGQVGVLPHGEEIISILKKYYKEGLTIQEATLGLVNELFGMLGLVVLMPDNPALKSLAKKLFEDELLNGHSSKITEETGKLLIEAGYQAQAYSRELNFFYLLDDKRERIEKENGLWKVVGTDIVFNKEQLLQELNEHPERFSPNVILRGIFQETILPDIAFIGGGGELAYWLQLKKLFEYYKVPYPLLVLRNSFLLINQLQQTLISKLDFDFAILFKPLQDLQNTWVQRNSDRNLSVDNAVKQAGELYETLSQQVNTIDITLLQHIEVLKKNTTKHIDVLGKKMLRAEKRNHDTSMRQIEKLQSQLFPNNNLQERMDNFIPYYAKYGPELIDDLYKNSLSLEQEFVMLGGV